MTEATDLMQGSQHLFVRVHHTNYYNFKEGKYICKHCGFVTVAELYIVEHIINRHLEH